MKHTGCRRATGRSNNLHFSEETSNSLYQRSTYISTARPKSTNLTDPNVQKSLGSFPGDVVDLSIIFRKTIIISAEREREWERANKIEMKKTQYLRSPSFLHYEGIAKKTTAPYIRDRRCSDSKTFIVCTPTKIINSPVHYPFYAHTRMWVLQIC